MATTARIEEYIVEYARAVGDAYIGVRDGIGSEDTPGTALFEMAQLSDLSSTNQLPRFGVLESSPRGFSVTYDHANEPTFVSVSGGTVAYKTQRISVEAQRVPIARATAKQYDNTYQYGVKLGFPLSEAKKASQLYSTVVSQSASSSDQVLYVADTATPVNLGFPLKAHVGTSFVVFSGFNSNGTALQVDPSFTPDGVNYGILGDIFPQNTRVYFIYEPRVQSIVGIPVVSSGTDPDVFSYYPPMPSDWLPIANVLVTAPTIATNIVAPTAAYISSTVSEWPSDATVFESSDAKTILKIVTASRANLKQVKQTISFGDAIAALTDYTNSIATNNNPSFRQYWGSQPFRANSYFARGVSFYDLERMEFPESFKKAYYDFNNDDLQHTFGIFRGDLYDLTNPLINNSQVSGLATHNFTSTSVPSTLRRGTYVYGVSAVLPSGSTYGETPASYIVTTTDTNSSNYFVNELTWSSVPGALFYHIYRRATVAGDQTEARLTTVGTVTGSGSFAIPTDTMSVEERLGNTYDAFKFTVGGTTPITEIELEIKSSLALTGTGTDYLTLNLVADSAGEPGAFMKQGENILFSEIGTGYTVFNKALAYTLVAGTYWIVIGRSATPSSNIYLHRGAYSSGIVPGEVSGTKVRVTPTLNADELLHAQAETIKISSFSGTQLGGLRLKLRKTSSVRNDNDFLTIHLHANNAGSPGAVVAAGTPIYFKDLTTSPAFYTSQFDYVLSGGSTYWIVIGRSSPPVGARISTYISTSVVTGQYGYAPDGEQNNTGTWTLQNNKTAYLRLLGWLDYGRTGLYLTRRGIRLTNNKAQTGRRLSVYVPAVEITSDRGRLPSVSQSGENVESSEDTSTKNELLVTVKARLGATGKVVQLPTVTIPRGTSRDTRFLLGGASDLYDRVDDIQVVPGANLRLMTDGSIDWSVYDLITVETAP
jgi:hypothetical protein